MELVKFIRSKKLSGGNRGDPERRNKIRMAIHKNKKGRERVIFHIGSKVCEKYRWLPGDPFTFHLGRENKKIIGFERTNIVEEGSTILRASNKLKGKPSVFNLELGYENTFPRVQKLTTLKVVREDGQIIICELP